MDVRKSICIALLGTLSFSALAKEDANPVEAVSLWVVMAAFFTIASPTFTTLQAKEAFTSAKDDAVAFVGSQGQIRGVRFERAVRVYQEEYPDRPISDQQLALALITAD